MKIESALYLIPVGISEASLEEVLPISNFEIIRQIRYFIVENLRSARRFLKRCDKSIDISTLTFYELNGHTDPDEVSSYLMALRRGEPIGLMSEAGCPGVADPGALAVRIAQNEGIKVKPLIGPSSILLALMGSGLNGQNFHFHGYLPVETREREKSLRELESASQRFGVTQIFIETPYRNQKMFESLIHTLKPETLLCVARSVTDPVKESIVTKKVKDWNVRSDQIGKEPVIFLFYCLNPYRD